MNFKQPLWMISVGHLLGVACLITGLGLIATGTVSAWWLLVWLGTHLLNSLMITVGLHRYFAHGAFRTSKFWHRFMAFYSVLLLNGSPFGWATAHIAHHLYSDTESDPHIATPSYLLWKRYRNVRMPKRRLRHIVGDDTLAFVHRYGMLLWLGVVGLLFLLGGWQLFLFGYGMGLGSSHLIGAMHQVLSHKDKQPRNLPWLEFILPACGEWNHKLHHEHATSKDMRMKWWHIDFGYLFIRAIEVK